MTWCPWLKSALSAFEPVNYILPIEPEITAHLHVGEGVRIADFGAFTRLLVNPGRLYLQALGDLRGGEYFFHVGWNCSFVCKLSAKR
jgi:hypothetical protein